MHSSVEMIEKVSSGFGDLLNQFIFVGGAIIWIYLDDDYEEEVRPTEDVDCFIKVKNRIDFSKMEALLREQNFKHALGKNDPICRWHYDDIVVDIMPTDENILGFSNRWYKEGLEVLEMRELPSGKKINCLPVSYFLCTKLDAFLDRGNDPRMSEDVEDIVTILDGVKGIEGIMLSQQKKILSFMSEYFQKLFLMENGLEVIRAHLTQTNDVNNRVERIRKICYAAVNK